MDELHRCVGHQDQSAAGVVAPGLSFNPLVDAACGAGATGKPGASVRDFRYHDGVAGAVGDLLQAKSAVQSDDPARGAEPGRGTNARDRHVRSLAESAGCGHGRRIGGAAQPIGKGVLQQGSVMWVIARQIQTQLLVQVSLFHERQDGHHPAELPLARHVRRTDRCGRKLPVHFVVVVQPQADVLEVVVALRTPCGLARRLRGRQQQGDQNADDGDDHQQFQQAEPAPFAGPDQRAHDRDDDGRNQTAEFPGQRARAAPCNRLRQARHQRGASGRRFRTEIAVGRNPICPVRRVNVPRGTQRRHRNFGSPVADDLGPQLPPETTRVCPWAVCLVQQRQFACLVDGGRLSCRQGNQVSALVSPHFHGLVVERHGPQVGAVRQGHRYLLQVEAAQRESRLVACSPLLPDDADDLGRFADPGQDGLRRVARGRDRQPVGQVLVLVGCHDPLARNVRFGLEHIRRIHRAQVLEMVVDLLVAGGFHGHHSALP